MTIFVACFGKFSYLCSRETRRKKSCETMRKRGTEKDGILLEGTMTLRCKALAGGRQSLYINHCVEGRHYRGFLSLYLEPENTVRAKRANASTLRKAEAILWERQSARLSTQLSKIEEQELKQLKDNPWYSADMFRASAHLSASKCGQPILGLAFLRYADVIFKQHKAKIETEYNKYNGT